MARPSPRWVWADLRRISAFRLIVWLGATFLLAIVALLAMVSVLTAQALTTRTDEALAHQAETLLRGPDDQIAGRIRAAMQANASGLAHYDLVSADGAVIAGDFPPPAGLSRPTPWNIPASGRMPPLRVLAVPLPDGAHLVVGRDISQIVELRAQFLRILVISSLVVVALSLLGACLVSLRPLRRVAHLKNLAARIGAGELGLRMPVSARNDELDVIAETVNRMVEEVASLLERVKSATDAIAHDLRTPLANTRQRLAELKAAPAEVAWAVDELDHVLSRFNALLRVAELEAGNLRANFTPLEPMSLVTQVCEMYEPLAEARGQQLSLGGDWGKLVLGDQQLLLEALGNLVDNAIKFTPDGGKIALQVAGVGGSVVVTVRDTGPGIPPHERAGAMDRFQRGSQVGHVPGTGLGLSLVASIARLHGFTLELADGGPGLVARIVAPPAEHR
ncbi:MAG: HAMP domain-containing protein [Proteobacteria bacterium]|nr:HAMP domain-containing protein [Pseudomonadota bacterium]